MSGVVASTMLHIIHSHSESLWAMLGQAAIIIGAAAAIIVFEAVVMAWWMRRQGLRD